MPPPTVAERSAAPALIFVVRLEECWPDSLSSTGFSSEQGIPSAAPPTFDAGATNGAARYLYGRPSSEPGTSGNCASGPACECLMRNRKGSRWHLLR